MSSLNDDAVADLDQDADYLTTLEGNAAALGTATVIADDHTDLEEPKDIDAAVEKLSDYDVQIQTTQNDITKMHSLQEVADTVLASESIGQSDAEEINRVYGNLYEEVASQKEFTEMPTKTNLNQTKEWIKGKLEAHFTEARNRHFDYIAHTEQYAKQVLAALNGGLVEELVAEYNALQQRCSDELSVAAGSSKFLAYRKREGSSSSAQPELVDLKKQPLDSQSLVNEFDLQGAMASLPSAEDIIKFRDVFRSTKFVRLIKLSNASWEPLEALHRDYHDRSNEDGRAEAAVSYLDILALFATGKIGEFFIRALEQLNQVAAKIQASIPGLLAKKLSKDEIEVEELSYSALVLSDYYERLLALEQYRMAAYMFAYRSKVLLDGFSKVLKA